jgi:hypothetical protein
MKSLTILLSALLLITLTAGCTPDAPVTPDEAREIAKEAYIYGFPMVVNYKTMYLYTINEESPEYKGPFNFLSCSARLLTPDDKAVVTPNADTPYCMFWTDIRNEPVVISVPEMEPERFYHFQLIDIYTHNFAYLGTLTTGNGAGKYLIANQNFKGKKPEGIREVITCETNLFFVVVRTQMMDQNDLGNVKRIQDQYKLETLSEFLGNESTAIETKEEFPEWHEGDQFTPAAFTYMDVMLGFINPLSEELEMMKRFARLGIGTGDGFRMSNFDEEVQEAIEDGVKEGFAEIEAFLAAHSSDPLMSAKIFGTREFLQASAEDLGLSDFYLLRAAAAQQGLYGNTGTEAIYPIYLTDSEGAPLNTATGNYTMTFLPDGFPPVKSFWSLTMYDAPTQLFIHNDLERYLLNSTMKDDFVYGDDGSLTFYVQKESPGPEMEANWLPAPDGPFYAVMRLYGPEEAALKGEWNNPPLVKAD